MDTKLTLRLDKEIIERAKTFAAGHNISLSKMIEAYLDSITKKSTDDIEITPLVESLSGVIRLEESSNPQKDYRDYIVDKYK